MEQLLSLKNVIGQATSAKRDAQGKWEDCQLAKQSLPGTLALCREADGAKYIRFETEDKVGTAVGTLVESTKHYAPTIKAYLLNAGDFGVTLAGALLSGGRNTSMSGRRLGDRVNQRMHDARLEQAHQPPKKDRSTRDVKIFAIGPETGVSIGKTAEGYHLAVSDLNMAAGTMRGFVWNLGPDVSTAAMWGRLLNCPVK